jgi:hypothetical protein
LFDNLLNSFIVLVALAGTAIWLRGRGTILPEDQSVFGRLVTDFALPALVFTSLSKEPFSVEKLLPAMVLFGSIAAVMVVAWLIARAMRLDRPVQGSVILVAGVGSSSTLGYSLIHHVFGDDPAVMGKVVAMGEMGVVLPLFSFGVAIAMYFGRDQAETETVSLWTASRPFFTSPIFLAMVLGLAVSFVGIPQEHRATRLLNDFMKVAGDSLSLLVAFTIGLMLRPIAYRKIAKLLVIVVGLKLVVEPLISQAAALVLDIPKLDRELLVLEAAMPSGTIAAVLAARYGCDGAVASALLVATYVVSLLALPLVVYIDF